MIFRRRRNRAAKNTYPGVGRPERSDPAIAQPRSATSRASKSKASPSKSSGLSPLLGGADRFVVVDTETTGVYKSDRLLEVALVTMSPEGDIVDVWDTLIQPERAVTATHIHGITAAMVAGAPTFEDIAGDVAVRLEGAAIVAHNLPFDHRMLNAEFARVGESLLIPAGIDTLSATRMKLTKACAQHGITVGEQQHRARNDALATAQLTRIVAQACKPASPAAAPKGLQRTGRVLRREDTISVPLPDPPPIAELATRLAYDTIEPAVLVYLEVLERAVEDLHLDRNERTELEFIAQSVGLDDVHIGQAHRRFVNEMIDTALADHILTTEEHDALIRVGAALNIDQARIETRLRPFQNHSTTIRIDTGMNVVFAGEHPTLTRNELKNLATAKGHTVQTVVTKATNIVAATEPESRSTKIEKARRYGTPIVAIDDFVSAEPGSNITANNSTYALKVITCPECLNTWTVSPQSNNSQRCADCQNPPKPRLQTKQPHKRTARSATETEQLTCINCGKTWERERTRGRKPHRCPSCAA